MEILLAAVNAKYIHSNLAVYSLQAYANAHGQAAEKVEYTVNHRLDDIMEDLYVRRPDVLCFSCYIWNIEMVKELAYELHRLCPEMKIWAGGPEVSFETEAFLKENPAFSGVMAGEGEKTFLELCRYYRQEMGKTDKKRMTLDQIPGLVFWQSEKTLCATGRRDILDLDELPFCYQNLSDFEHRIIYYESSRGCPFSCSYCLSSVDKKLRFRSLPLVFQELQFFIDHKVEQVKFVDRTFNCDRSHARAIWKYLTEHDRGITNFHFEISADLLEEEDLELMSHMRPGLIQLEIGVQSTHAPTIREIRRTMHLGRLKETVQRIQSGNNIHQHLDLIAGLPYEDYEQFQNSFDEIYALHPQQLQLGFLKVLKGSYMYENQAAYGLLYRKQAPYEVLATKWLSFDEVLKIRSVEEMLEIHYNSHQFEQALHILETEGESYFQMYRKLAEFYKTRVTGGQSLSRLRRAEFFAEFAAEIFPEKQDLVREALTFDLYARENIKRRPHWAFDLSEWKKPVLDWLRSQGKDKKYCHLERFSLEFVKQLFPDRGTVGSGWVFFDYENRDPLTNAALIYPVEVADTMKKDT